MNSKVLPCLFLAGILSLGIVGCSQDTGYSTNDLPILQENIVDTVCSVSGKRIMDKEDVTKFLSQAEQLREYTGENAERLHNVADNLEATAHNWQLTLGTDLGEANAEALTDTCKAIEEAYGKTHE